MKLGKLVRGALFAGGVLVTISGAVNIVSAFQLIGPTEERELGITRGSVILQFSLLPAAGLAMIFLGIWGGGRQKEKGEMRNE